MLSLTEKILVDIFKSEFSLSADQVIIRNQNFKMPNDDRLYIIVGMIDSMPYGVALPRLEFQSDGSDGEVAVEVQEAQINEFMQIDIISRTPEAIQKKVWLIHALNSLYSKQKQEENNFKIARISRSFVNTSYAEGGSNLNRFSLTVSCLTWHRRIKTPPTYDYFDQFSTRLDDEKTIGTENPIAEFEITPDTPEPPIIG